MPRASSNSSRGPKALLRSHDAKDGKRGDDSDKLLLPDGLYSAGMEQEAHCWVNKLKKFVSSTSMLLEKCSEVDSTARPFIFL